MLDYFIKVLLFQTLFLAVYDLFLKRETFFQWNRAYLIGTSVVAYIIPALKIEQVEAFVSLNYQEYIIQLPEIMLSPTAVIEKQVDWSVLLFTTLQWVFWIGIVIATVLFLVRLNQIIRLIYTNEKEHRANFSLVHLNNRKAFSFFSYIFLGKEIEPENKSQIINHELVHVEQKHSIDLLFFELQKIVCWFNPFSYVFQHRIAELHEFIADSKSVKEIDKSNYFQNLLAQTFQVQKISFINPFLKVSLIKKRIVMLNKNKSKQVLKLKYLLLLPVLVSMLVYTSCENKEDELKSKTESIEEITFAIIEKAPIFPGCEDAADSKKCLQEQIQKHVAIKYNTSLAGDLELEPGKKRVYVQFTIDKNGEIIDVKARGPHAALEEEAVRVVKSLPKMISGEHKGKKVGVKYTLPITLMIAAENTKKMEATESFDPKNSEIDESVPFAAVEEIPIFPGCEDAEDIKKCVQEQIQKHITKNFNAGMANTLSLDKGKNRVYVQFTIDKEGDITDVKSRGPHEALEKEAIRVVNDLPKMIPGKLGDGKKVSVKYTLPITLMVD